MSEIIINTITGLENLHIGKFVCEADKGGVFNMDLENIGELMIQELPLNRNCLVTKDSVDLQHMSSSNVEDWPDEITLLIRRIDTDLIEINFQEEALNSFWLLEITPGYYYKLKEWLLCLNTSINSQIINHFVSSGGDVTFEFSIKLNATTINELFKKATEINSLIDRQIINAIEIAKSHIQIVLGKGLQIKLPKSFFRSNKNNNDSEV